MVVSFVLGTSLLSRRLYRTANYRSIFPLVVLPARACRSIAVPIDRVLSNGLAHDNSRIYGLCRCVVTRILSIYKITRKLRAKAYLLCALIYNFEMQLWDAVKWYGSSKQTYHWIQSKKQSLMRSRRRRARLRAEFEEADSSLSLSLRATCQVRFATAHRSRSQDRWQFAVPRKESWRIEPNAKHDMTWAEHEYGQKSSRKSDMTFDRSHPK